MRRQIDLSILILLQFEFAFIEANAILDLADLAFARPSP